MTTKDPVSTGKEREMVPKSSPEKRLQPFLEPLIFIGIVPRRRPSTFLKSPCRNLVVPTLICLVMWFGTAFSILQIFFCHSPKSGAAHKASFLDVIEDFRRNLQIFCGAFNICLFCWKARQIPQLLDRAREFFGRGSRTEEQNYSPSLVAYFTWLFLLYACVAGAIFTSHYFDQKAALFCFGADFAKWDLLDMIIKALEMVVTTYITGLLCGVMLLLYDACQALQKEIASFVTETNGKTLQKLRRSQEQVISFCEECNGVFASLHLLVLSDAISVTIVAVGILAHPASQEDSSADGASADSFFGGNASAAFTTMNPAKDAPSVFHAFFLYAMGMVELWGILGNCVVALIVLFLANLALQSASNHVTAELETLESMHAVGSISIDPSRGADAELASLLERSRRRPITLQLWLADLRPDLIFKVAAGLYAYYSFALNYYDQVESDAGQTQFRNKMLNVSQQLLKSQTK